MPVKILVVEDSPTMRQLVVFSLRSIPDVKIVEAEDGLDGLKKVQSESFDLAMVDINMPLMDGLKLISLMRQDPRNGNVPIVVVTTESGGEVMAKARDMGVNAFVTKPVVAGSLLKTVKTLLQEGSLS